MNARKITLAVAVVLFFAAEVVAVAYIKDYLNKPSPLTTCAEQQDQSPFAVRLGCEPGEQTNLDEVSDLLARLPEALNNGDTTLLSNPAEAQNVDDILPDNATIVPYLNTWERTGTVASMEVKVRYTWGILPRFERFLAVFSQKEDGAWKISQTYRL